MKTEDVGATKLMRACEFGELGTVLSMIEKGVDINEIDAHNNTALMYAIVNDDKGHDRALIIKKLLEKGANANVRNMEFESPAILAAKHDDPTTLRKLLELTSVNELEMIDMIDGKNVFQYAAENSCKNVIDEFNSKKQVPVPVVPAPRSLLTRITDAILYPFRLIGSVIKSVGAAVVQLFINKSAKPRTYSDASSIGSEYEEMSDKVDNPQTITKLTSQSPEQEETRSKKKFDLAKEKKPATQFSISTNPDGGLDHSKLSPDLRGIQRPKSPGTPGSKKQEI